MTTVDVVANYILNRLGFVSTMKLQKLTFYSQAYSLVNFNSPLFQCDFQAWANGPVCPELFSLHRGRFIIGPGDLGDSSCSESLEHAEQASIDAVLSVFGDFDGNTLSDMTHQERPWIDARKGIGEGERSANVISKESIKSFYSSAICQNPVFQSV